MTKSALKERTSIRRKPKERISGAIAFWGLISALMIGCSGPENAGMTNDPSPTPQESDQGPNVLLIVVDDMGFNDLSLFGSEIETPNLDALAREGLTLTDFNAGPTCSPTRSMLLTGADSHLVGLGNMAESLAESQKGRPGYEGYLNTRAATLPELLKDAGYNTYMTGKWHLGITEETSPLARGFDRSFILVSGGAGAFQNQLAIFSDSPTIYRENGKLVETLPEGFYSTHYYTEKMMGFIDADLRDHKPFFAYLAYTSPHWPLQAPQESIAKYMGKYDDGYEALNQRRLDRLKELGLFESIVERYPQMPGQQSWSELSEEERRFESKKMAIYAAMVDDVDIYVGKIIDHLKAIGEYDNTLIFFMSDNGPEGGDVQRYQGMDEHVEACCDNSYENMGNANSYFSYGSGWAQAGNTPLRSYKGYTSLGGVHVPAFAHFPKAYAGARTSDAFLTVKDFMPTLLELAGMDHPGAGMYKGREVVAMEGRSMLSLFKGETDIVRKPNDYMGWELWGRRAIRQGDWKIIYLPEVAPGKSKVPGINTNTWQLYNLAEDPTEIRDLSAEEPEKLADLVALWGEYESRNGVLGPN